jgi:hypothetical protein
MLQNFYIIIGVENNENRATPRNHRGTHINSGRDTLDRHAENREHPKWDIEILKLLGEKQQARKK